MYVLYKHTYEYLENFIILPAFQRKERIILYMKT